VVGVEVGQDDVAYVVGVEPERGQLADGRLGAGEGRAYVEPGGAEPPGRVVSVLGPEPGIDEDESVAGLDEEDVAGQAVGGMPGRMVPQLRWRALIRTLP